MDRLASMAAFVKAVELGSFSAAAAALGLSAPMIGKHVQFLEGRLGARLLNRTTRRQSLTDFGQGYYDRCRVILGEVKAADALAQDHQSEPRGKLKITAPVHFGRRCVLPALIELARSYPKLELDLSFSDRVVDLAEDGFDLAIRTGDLADRAGVIARRIARQPMIVCAAPAYLEEHGRPDSIEDISKRHAIVYRRSGPIPPWLFPLAAQPCIEVTPQHRIRLDDLDAIADAAEMGAGLAWLPHWLVRDRILQGRLITILPQQQPFLYDCHAIWLQTPHLPLKVRVTIDRLAAVLPGLMA